MLKITQIVTDNRGRNATTELPLILCVIVFILLFSNLRCIPINAINSITGGEMVIEYDSPNGPIFRYKDRLIVNNRSKIEEFRILEGGQLNRIGFFEILNNITYPGMIYNDKYINLNQCPGTGTYQATVFDLSVEPMKFMTTFDTRVPTSNFTKMHIYDDCLFFVDGTNSRRVMFNLDTFEYIGYINDEFATNFEWIIDDILISRHSRNLKFRKIIDLKENKTELIYDLNNPEQFRGANYLYREDDRLYVSNFGGFSIIDISDIENPRYEYVAELDHDVFYAIHTDEYLFTSAQQGYLRIYRFDDNKQLSLVYEKVGINGLIENMYYEYPYLYVCNGFSLTVYDVSNEFNEVLVHDGEILVNPQNIYILTHDDLYFIDVYQGSLNKSIINIYSVLDQELFCSINNDAYLFTAYTRMIIEDNKIYESFHLYGHHHFRIFNIEDKKGVLLHEQPLNRSSACFSFYKTNHQAYFYYYYLNLVDVYDIVGNELVFNGSFSGTIQNKLSNQPDDFIVTHHNNRLYFRDKEDFRNIIYEVSSIPSGDINYINDNYLSIHTLTANAPERFSSRIYSYNLNNKTMNLFQSVPTDRMSVHNQLITQYDTTSNKTKYYTVFNNEYKFLFEKVNFADVQNTFFFPERNRLIEVAKSGVRIYNIDFTVSEFDAVAEVNLTGLIGNYPNPFNPNTNINFSLSHGDGRSDGYQNVRIDIYNIKGQKIRSLINNVYPVGEHSVLWNGYDDNGREVTSGVYFYKMVTEGYTQTKKMVLIK